MSINAKESLTVWIPSALFFFWPVIACVTSNQEASAQSDWIAPPALKQGDLIAFVAASGPVEVLPVETYAAQLRNDGYRVFVPAGLVTRKQGYLAGTDDERLQELNAMIRDPNVRAIFPIRGGYGLTRILDRIDYDALRKDPKVVIGFSDVTALHLAIAKKSKLITFHSPVPMGDLWKGSDPEFSFAYSAFNRTIFAKQYTSGEQGFVISTPDGAKPESLVRGIAKGRLLGGNLTMICSTWGTPFALEPAGAILFLEDVNEAPYRVDRMLSQLKLAGALDQLAGIIVGMFTIEDAGDLVEFDRLFKEYFSALGIPVIHRYPIGHVAKNGTLPHGALVELDANRCEVRLLENPVQLK